MYSNICYDFICIYHFKLKVMQTIEERAKSYIKGCELQGKEARKAEFDYIAGAKEERILVVEWLERNVPQIVARFKTDFGIELPKYYGDDDSRAE